MGNSQNPVNKMKMQKKKKKKKKKQKTSTALPQNHESGDNSITVD